MIILRLASKRRNVGVDPNSALISRFVTSVSQTMRNDANLPRPSFFIRLKNTFRSHNSNEDCGEGQRLFKDWLRARVGAARTARGSNCCEANSFTSVIHEPTPLFALFDLSQVVSFFKVHSSGFEHAEYHAALRITGETFQRLSE